MRFNPPPNWPPVPPGWTPGPDWRPPAEWPPGPPGWQFWVDDSIERARAEYAAKLQAKADAKDVKAAQRAAELEQYGPEVYSSGLGGDLRLYERGYIKMSSVLVTRKTPYQRLLGVEVDVQAGHKNKAGRLAMGIITQGWSLDTSDLKGDIWITIHTDQGPCVIHDDTPTLRSIQNLKQFEFLANSLVQE